MSRSSAGKAKSGNCPIAVAGFRRPVSPHEPAACYDFERDSSRFHSKTQCIVRPISGTRITTGALLRLVMGQKQTNTRPRSRSSIPHLSNPPRPIRFHQARLSLRPAVRHAVAACADYVEGISPAISLKALATRADHREGSNLQRSPDSTIRSRAVAAKWSVAAAGLTGLAILAAQQFA